MRTPLLAFFLCLQLSGQSTDQHIAGYQKQLRQEPRNQAAQLALAKAYIQKVRETADFGYLDRASALVDRVMADGNAAYQAMRLRSEIELERHRFADVADYSEELTRLKPEDPWNWGTLGDALMELGEYDRAGKAYARMVELRPDLSSYNRLSYYRFVTGDAAGAIAAMQKAIVAGSTAPEHVAWCLVDLGNLYLKTGAIEQAEQTYRQALRKFPKYYPAYAGLGRAARARNRTAAAIDYFLRAYAALPLPEYAAALDALYRRSGKPKEADRYRELVRVVDQMSRASGESTDRSLAMIYLDQNRNIERASELIEEELKVRQDVYTFDALAWLNYRRGRFAEAWQASLKALAKNTPEASFHYHASLIAAALGDPEKARQHVATLLQLNPHFDLKQAAATGEIVAKLR